MELSSLSFYKVLGCSLDEGWSVHARLVLSGHDLTPGRFFPLWPKEHLKTVQHSAIDTESLCGFLV